ncbi:putative leucine-rich repeat protein (LRRP) [Trypanosoma cruzi]|nr:putative leucine-rich repeat protein (LRRP) [Trypanosoma cruzi]
MSVVGPDDMARCMEGFKAPTELILDGIRFSPVRVVGVEEYQQLRTLSLCESVLENYEWIARATYLAKLDLSATRVKEEDLVGLCRLLFYLETLLLRSCKHLSTSLSFLLPLHQMRSVSISNFSLLRNNCIALLRERGVLCDVS